ncbi:hypothetical protein Rhe02_34300 [Rhizocola hellebori]|uniref:Nitroreductase domain-containing protein n=1 Tax=Rhizocola hellebori TaxID=1392758 RepID=A0A8J3Q8W7_9ACTN|nr:nitroreductase family protein [Rhizocola hellebori]GIH05363.1 hypothetical protein Rhe02_34300 [Rhizocola hellebori]
MSAVAGAPPGEAVRRYLRVAERQPTTAILSTDWRQRPSTLKRYAPFGAVSLAAPGSALEVLSRLLSDSYGLVRYRWDDVGSYAGHRFPGMPSPGRAHRAVASGGGLYPSELYLVTAQGWGGGRPASVLHYDPAGHALDPVRPGDWREAIASPAGLAIVVTSVFARTAFKYQEFGFRLQCLDAGVLIGQLLTAIESAGLSAQLRLRFDDAAVAAVLGLETDVEAPLALIDMEGVTGTGTAATGERPESAARQPSPRTKPAAVLDVLPLTRDLHRSARTAVGVRWPAPLAADAPLPAAIARVELPQPSPRSLTAAIAQRRSLNGRFGTDAVPLAGLAAVLDAAYRWPSARAARAGLDHLIPLCVVHRVDGVQPGLYRYRPDTHDLHLLRPADLRMAMAPTDLIHAQFLGDHGAGAVLIPLGDYERGLAAAGDRWFQMQNIPAGISIQRATLASAALGLACRVVCSFDVSHLAGVLGLQTGPLRPLCQLLIGSTGTDVGYDQPI